MSIAVGIVAVAWARSQGEVTPAMLQLFAALRTRGASQGHWHAAVRSIEPVAARSSAAPDGMAEGLRLGKKGTGLIADLEVILVERNKWAHRGGPHNKVEADERAQHLLPCVDRALATAQFLARPDWVFVEHSSYRRRERAFHVRAARAMGEHPDFERIELVSPEPLVDESFYLWTGTGPVELNPLVVQRYCPTCHQPELWHSDRVDAQEGVSLKSFDRGHMLHDAKLVDDMHAFLDTDGIDVPTE